MRLPSNDLSLVQKLRGKFLGLVGRSCDCIGYREEDDFDQFGTNGLSPECDLS
jgi:hypothetical protein